MSEFKQFLQFMKWLIPAILLVVGMMYVPEGYKEAKKFLRHAFEVQERPPEGIVAAIDLKRVGELVALIAKNSVAEKWEQADTWLYSGKQIIISCDCDFEYRFDMAKAVVEQPDKEKRAFVVKLPAGTVKCIINDLRVLDATEGYVPLWGKYRIRPDQLNKVFEKAKARAMKSAMDSEVYMEIAEQSLKQTLAALFGGAEIDFQFAEPTAGGHATSYDDSALRENAEKAKDIGNGGE